MNAPQKIDLGALTDSIERLERMFPSEREVPPVEELARRHGKIAANTRAAGVIVAAIKSSGMTLNEMGTILEAITDRVCPCIREYPELEETAHDLALICEEYEESMRKINDRLYRQQAECDGRT